MISIKTITAEETYSLRHSVMWPNQPISFVMLSDDEKGIHFGLFVNEILTSVISLFISDKKAQFRKFATLKHEQGKGYGTKLLKHTINFVSAKTMEELWCNARTDKTKFYKKFGFTETKKKFTKENIDFVILEKKLK
ncbi:MAG: GNAT family N-acetyltransferase [Cellulophaga sp.]|nr:GNAT family N-acetyltransferase [Cellulophaga sp.]